MSRLLPWKSPLMALGTAVMLAACGGAEPEVPPSTTGEVQAMGPTTCDPASYCRVPTQHVRCADGFIMYAYRTSDGWCIEQDICARHGGPLICPLRPD
ncbi:hypothetical protein ACLESO_28720 [Pyxidicoccus sp. 3LG]